ncbi:peptidoglycan DD-metalloendopeptidase family protein [Segetibacter sp.]|jgi:septal ring factor EnvC (AmiA/AmiB activator)|uniref:murein hydrolase activator EnvC family protein n=1 Tax=Segetibacter sp. TaxID=2231182 RepID=UPI00260FA61F|nr:peptidoglycan DD-metalloendopeptidase family protein [Segetibacter sp.]MCW3081474.1 peptidoglycan DD-metalloendopeptidase family protein [Segetibacter sp.]
MIKKVIFLFLFSLFSVLSFAQQTKEELQRKQQDLLKEIRDLNASLKNIRNNKNRSLANYNLVKRKIAAREELIQNINKDLRILDNNIYKNTLEISRLRKELDTLKREYARSLLFAYKNRSNYDYLNFIFSASTFNDAIKRITYLKSYRQYREQQVANIEKTQDLISDKIATLNSTKNEKSMALQVQNNQLKDLEVDKKEQNEEVNKLKTKENEFAKEIRKRENDRRQMQAAISAIIKRELAEARKKAEALAKQKRAAEDERRKRVAEQQRQERLARQQAAANNGSNTAGTKAPAAQSEAADDPSVGVVTTKPKTNRVYSDLETTDEGRALSINFEGRRGSLPWPVDAGVPTIHFGSYTIPGTQLRGKSDGLTIAVPLGASVKAVADGEVSSVFDLGGEQVVTVRHGKYFTSYSHLSSVNVNKDQEIKSGTVIGRAASNDEGEGEVVFMVTNEHSVFLNPEQWLRRK